MATISVTIDDEHLTRIQDAFAACYNYQPILENGTPNPETRAKFTRRMVATYIRETVRAHEANIAAEAARQQAINNPVNVS